MPVARWLGLALLVSLEARGGGTVSSEQAIEDAVQQAWKQLPEAVRQGPGRFPWRPATTPCVPAHWPPGGGAYAYAYAQRFDQGLADGERVGSIWGRVQVAADGKVSFQSLGTKITDIGIQGFRPVAKEEIDLHQQNGKRLQPLILAAHSEKDLDAVLAQQFFTKWRGLNGVIAEKVAALHPDFFAWLTPPKAAARVGSGFALYLIEGRHVDRLSYNYADPAWKDFLEKSPLTEVWIQDGDIARYDWESQDLILGKEASERVRAALGKGLFSLTERSFIATLAGRRLYAGTILFKGSARAIDYPVIYVDAESRDGVALELRPAHSVMTPYAGMPADAKRRIELPEVKAHFAQLGKLGATGP